MNYFFTEEQGIVFTRLIIAHIITDFLIQPKKWVDNKRQNTFRSHYLYMHGLLSGFAVFILQPGWSIAVPVFIAITHTLIDLWKLMQDKKGTLSYFLADQILHLIIIVISLLYLTNGYEQSLIFIQQGLLNYRVLVFITGYLFCIFPLGFIIKFATQNLVVVNNNITATGAVTTEEDIRHGGRLIGIFERMIILTFVLYSQYEAIGFLITGKSILRLGSKKQTEYVLVGTMMSYALSILTGVLINILLNRI
ncbi:MAG: DUF3307 domain-containing protein [Bacteroidota bacterium]